MWLVAWVVIIVFSVPGMSMMWTDGNISAMVVARPSMRRRSPGVELNVQGQHPIVGEVGGEI